MKTIPYILDLEAEIRRENNIMGGTYDCKRDVTVTANLKHGPQKILQREYNEICGLAKTALEARGITLYFVKDFVVKDSRKAD